MLHVQHAFKYISRTQVSISKFSSGKTTSLLSANFTHNIKRKSNGTSVKLWIIVCVFSLNSNN